MHTYDALAKKTGRQIKDITESKEEVEGREEGNKKGMWWCRDEKGQGLR